ncbi:hypothetical protein NDU88_000522 [Pleurodeles waltl]|uniref:Uncharacterized protein n=1 Tax=Pleurodeles waltl TaxID=8319 RepID=A0AAV7KNK5_PLEWA|nr:hypothetical protein NDU88_000522 [Pleurodeles waltl]
MTTKRRRRQNATTPKGRATPKPWARGGSFTPWFKGNYTTRLLTGPLQPRCHGVLLSQAPSPTKTLADIFLNPRKVVHPSEMPDQTGADRCPARRQSTLRRLRHFRRFIIFPSLGTLLRVRERFPQALERRAPPPPSEFIKQSFWTCIASAKTCLFSDRRARGSQK